MRFLANLFKINSTKKGAYPGDTQGDSIIATGEGSAGKGETAQVYGHHGFISNPAKGVKSIRLRIGSIDIIIAAFNYGVSFPENQGETKVYSTDAAGTEQAKHELKTDGSHVFNGGTNDAARNGDSVSSSATDDPTFWAWIAAAGSVLAGLGVAAPIPTSLAGKITSGTNEVKLP